MFINWFPKIFFLTIFWVAFPFNLFAQNRLVIPLIGTWNYEITRFELSSTEIYTGTNIQIYVNVKCLEATNSGIIKIVMSVSNSYKTVYQDVRKINLFPAGKSAFYRFDFYPPQSGKYNINVAVYGGTGFAWKFMNATKTLNVKNQFELDNSTSNVRQKRTYRVQWIERPIIVAVNGKSYYFGKIINNGTNKFFVTDIHGNVIRDESILKKVFFVQYVYRFTFTGNTTKSARIVQLDDAINDLQTTLNMSYLSDAVLFIRELSSRALLEAVLVAVSGGTSVGKSVIKTSGKVIAKESVSSAVHTLLKDPLTYLKAINYETLQTALNSLQNAKAAIIHNMNSGYFTYESTYEIYNKIIYGLSRKVATQKLQGYLYLQQGGSGDIFFQLNRITEYMVDQLVGDIISQNKYKNMIYIGHLGYSIIDFIMEHCPVYAKYVEEIKKDEKFYNYESSPYYQINIKNSIDDIMNLSND